MNLTENEIRKEREAFEKWARETKSFDVDNVDDFGYMDMETSFGWIGWLGRAEEQK